MCFFSLCVLLAGSLAVLQAAWGFGCMPRTISVGRKCVKCAKGHKVRQDVASLPHSELITPYSNVLKSKQVIRHKTL